MVFIQVFLIQFDLIQINLIKINLNKNHWVENKRPWNECNPWPFSMKSV